MDRQTMHKDIYRACVEESSEGIWVAVLKEVLSIRLPIDRQLDHLFRHLIIVDCNPALAEMYLLHSPEEVKGRLLFDLMDSSHPKNVESLKTFLKAKYETRIIETRELDRIGAWHFFAKRVTGTVHNGYLNKVWGIQRDITLQKRRDQMRNELLAMLTPRELETLRLTTAGRSLKEIADVLGIGLKTVETHRARILHKLAIRDVPTLISQTISLRLLGDEHKESTSVWRTSCQYQKIRQ